MFKHTQKIYEQDGKWYWVLEWLTTTGHDNERISGGPFQTEQEAIADLAARDKKTRE